MSSKRPIILVVDDQPGCSADFIARRLARHMAEQLQLNVIVENRAEDGEGSSAASIAKAAPDGYTLYMASRPTVLNQRLHKNRGYDFARDFAPVAMITHVPYVLVTSNYVPGVKIQELLAQDRSTQYGLACASDGDVGSTPRLIYEVLRERAELRWLDMPCDTDASALTAVIAGRANFAIIGVPSAVPHLGSRGLRALAVFSGSRLPFLPVVPSIAEFDLSCAEAQGWFALVVPSRTPTNFIERLNQVVNKALAGVSVGKKLMQLGYTAPAAENTPQALGTFIAQDTERWVRVLAHRTNTRSPRPGKFNSGQAQL
ncbi:tripartite tricarboxylate transporter substrate-binding protein [Bordetella sp. LUAb4]|uniref:tripartite tricarboxylate transporter substrate-binding protein n=1 Tax=Bordetella sp. LUAb4 TaxID=2843195 RepID=UPI0021072690|nr:tripartite tricarboxylate transporter substrate-binding protein [Bordetella sp. LUAb4]